jgi:hypothetical protein
VARLSPNSSVTLTVLRGAGSNGEAQITLEGGLGYFELQGGTLSGTIKVNFGDSVATASGFTVMRINLDTPPGELAVFSGNAHLERGSAVAVDMHGGESLALSANDVSRYTLNETIEPDSWDSWNSDRDQVLTSEAATATGATKNYAQAATRRGTIWMRMATGITSPARETSGRRMKQPTADGTPTATGTGC